MSSLMEREARCENAVGEPLNQVADSAANPIADVSVAVLTGGADRPYAFGLCASLMTKVRELDMVVCDELDGPPFCDRAGVKLLNLRGSVDPAVSSMEKMLRVLKYYVRLLTYALTARPRVFHILWNNKFEYFDRTILMLYYRFLGKRIVLTIHNVNKLKRDKNDSWMNRSTLRMQYRLADHLFVHTEIMKTELREDFGVDPARVTVIPFGINNSVPDTALSGSEARKRLGLRERDKVLLFFGHITPYKGLEYLVSAFQKLVARDENLHLVIAGRPKECPEYWGKIEEGIRQGPGAERVLVNAGFIPDEGTEIYFKAADVLVLPYRYIYQSGVLFLGHSFGLPALVADVGSLKDDIVEGKTGLSFKSEDADDLASVIGQYFASDLYRDLARKRPEIRRNVEELHSWDAIGKTTLNIYRKVLGKARNSPEQAVSGTTDAVPKATSSRTSN